MKTACLAFLVFLSVAVSAQDISNEKTKKHVYIPGTRIWIIPPEGFSPSTDFTGLKKDDGTFIKIYDMTGGNYYSQINYKASADRMGSVVFEHSENKFNGYAAQYLYLQDQPGTRNCVLMFGDSTCWIMALAVFPSLDDQLAAEVKKSIQSIVYDKTIKIDPFVGAIYTLNDKHSEFKYAKSGQNLLVFTRGGVEKEFYGNAAVMLFATVPDTARGAKTLCENFIDTYREKFPDIEQKNARYTQINGHRAYEVECYMTDKEMGAQRLIYLLAVLDKNRAVVLSAATPQDFQRELYEFKQLGYTIKFK